MRLLVATLLAGCVHEVAPEPYNSVAPMPDGFDRATEIVRGAWSARLETELPAPPAATYYLGCLIYPDRYMRQEWYDGCVEGRYWHIDETVDIRAVGDGPADDALAHEMLHWALDLAEGDANADHDHPLWAAVPELKATLATDALCRAEYALSTCDRLLP